MLAQVALDEGFEMTADPMEAEVIVVNTCGFIEEAKRESIDAILDLSEARESGRCRQLVVAGCLAERYPSELASGLPEADHVIGLGRLEALRSILRGVAPDRRVAKRRVDFPTQRHGRLSHLPRPSAYVKIGEGCSRRCAFCAIPSIRGPAVSRRPGGIVREVRRLAAAGVSEIVLVSQDTSAYGRDLAPRVRIEDLVDRLRRVRGIRWVRVLYLYPDRAVRGLTDLFAAGREVVPYVDLPLQHVTDRMLRIMRRGHDRAHALALVEHLRNAAPSMTLRTTFIVGHPGETERDFEAMAAFIERIRPERIGVLRYSAEEGTAAARRPDRVPPSTVRARAEAIEALAARVLEEHNEALVGTERTVMVEGPSDQGPYLLDARMPSQAPEVDGKVVVAKALRAVAPGETMRVRITRVMGADLLADAL